MGRTQYESHSKAKNGLFTNLENEGHQINKIVLSKIWSKIPEDTVFKSKYETLSILCHDWIEVEEALDGLSDKISEAWNLGGAAIYEEHLKLNKSLSETGNPVKTGDKLYLTKIQQEFDCDVFYPVKYLPEMTEIEQNDEIIEENKITYTFHTHLIYCQNMKIH